jgi:hypothetical protein
VSELGIASRQQIIAASPSRRPKAIVSHRYERSSIIITRNLNWCSFDCANWRPFRLPLTDADRDLHASRRRAQVRERRGEHRYRAEDLLDRQEVRTF